MGKVILVCLILLGILLLLAYIEDKLQDNAKPSGQIQSVPLKDVNLYIDYELYADALIACVNSNCEILGLRQPKDRPYHYAPPQERIHRSCRNLFYSYLFEREFDISSGNGMKKSKILLISELIIKRYTIHLVHLSQTIAMIEIYLPVRFMQFLIWGIVA